VLGHQVPGLIIAHDQPVHPECLEMAKKYGVSVMTTEVDTSEFYAQLIGTLRRHLAPRGTVHGVLVEVHGEGMLIIGDSGIGKSETALELIKRGHRLIADDAVEILRTSRTTLEGRSPAIIQYFMELRGIGVINVQNVFGIGAVKPSCPIDLVVAMELWDETRCYDRLGLDTETWEYLGISVPRVTIPVRPGRNLAVILELAAMTNRQKKLGYNAAEELAQRIDAQVDSGIDF
jgi:HPr kinase/phosphorylase